MNANDGAIPVSKLKLEEARKAKDKATVNYFNKGYFVPINTLQLLKELYTSSFTREFEKSYIDGREMSQTRQDRIDTLNFLTEAKLLNVCMQTFKKDPNASVNLVFRNGKPDEETSEFLRLKDETRNFVNISRTSALRMNHVFFSRENSFFQQTGAGDTAIISFCVFRDGEQISGAIEDQSGNIIKEEIFVNTIPFIRSQIENVEDGNEQ